MTPLFRKLNLKEGPAVVLNPPPEIEPELEELETLGTVTLHRGDEGVDALGFVLAFVTRKAEIDAVFERIASRLAPDAVLWFAYPKGSSKRYRCDFNRDTGWAGVGAGGFEPVRQVAIDEDWSALRFRRAEHIRKMTRDPKRAISDAGRTRLEGSEE